MCELSRVLAATITAHFVPVLGSTFKREMAQRMLCVGRVRLRVAQEGVREIATA